MHDPIATRIARDDAERMRNRAFWNHVLRGLRGLPNELLPFEAVRGLRPDSESYAGIRSIPIEAIVGSVDRYRDFDHAFLPRLGYPVDRWVGIRRARLQGANLPAIEVYRVGGVYFVKDGHHRVSVARSEGQRFIDAEVVELVVPVAPCPGDGLKELVLKGESADFLARTGLGDSRPGHRPLLFSVPGRFGVVLEHLATHRFYVGRERGQDPGWTGAAASWYDRVYAPVASAIDAHRVLRRFPGRTEADLYLWIMDHLYYLRERGGDGVDAEAATSDFTRRFAASPWRRRRLTPRPPRARR